jgi:CDP-glucose 4,6-dehydratase
MNLFNGVYKSKKVLLTGDTGFKGSWLSIWLKEMGAEVYGYALPPKKERDNFVSSKLSRIIHHEDGDIRDQKHLLKYFKSVLPDIAFHLAAQPLVVDSYKDPHYTFETNVMGTVNFFEAVRNTPSVKAAINITSDKCYQNNEWIWGYRENDPMGGKDPYSASKGASEIVTNSYFHSFFSKENTCSIASARAGNVIGGGDWSDFRIIPDFFRALEKGEILQLRYPNATRPWQHVLEPLGGYLLLAVKLFAEGKKYSGGWNFGPFDENNCTVRELVEAMIMNAGKGSYEVLEAIENLHEASLLKLDISKAVHCLQWKPVLNFEETVEMTVKGYKDEINNNNIYQSRVKQIEEYIQIAKTKKVTL